MTLRNHSISTTSLDVTWQQPTFLLPLFCLCSLLATTESLAMAIGMAVTLLLATLLCCLLLWLAMRVNGQPPATVFWLVACGAVVAILELLLHAGFYNLYRALGLFLPLSVISCLLLVRLEMQQPAASLRSAVRRTLLMSTGYGLAAVVLGAARELVGRGSLFIAAGELWGSWAQPLEIQLFRADMGFLLAVLAPGAFIGLGLGVALYNWLSLRWLKQ
jgi:electron transport complex protein RnfE